MFCTEVLFVLLGSWRWKIPVKFDATFVRLFLKYFTACGKMIRQNIRDFTPILDLPIYGILTRGRGVFYERK